jgi:hemerythrin-like domain-containing protein
MPSKKRVKSTPIRSKSRTQSKDAISMLKEDHKTVRGLLGKMELASGRASKSRDALFAKLEQEIKIHSELENEIFYPAFKDAVRKKDDQQLFFEAEEEHHLVDVVLGGFGDEERQPEEFAAHCKVLKDLVEHHLKEEEQRMFPIAKKVMDKSVLQDLGQRIQERKQEMMSQAMRRAS